ncbi:hypothetical protein LJ737_09540 [Hymenobacter sp. 15J16-1T3B]|uniref:hypothetical protein n=1 Tax=Hymenobacter sp. 15J16-1T3B TaxID=2886941 RepID=UPI001D10E8B0|nr:hypothetical protein [Hymenobacter sp. 15J16-1T3B]MCC3157482.1 hypothetical protein [Hymenobacter sp. 15J16-1T3B]
MKQLLLLLGLLAVLATSAAAKPRRPGRPAVQPAAVDSVQQRAACYTQYLTDALRLSSRQALAVHRFAAEQAHAAAPAAAWQRFDEQMLGILSPGQYNAFAWLAGRLPR